jgi:hypothetical protein
LDNIQSLESFEIKNLKNVKLFTDKINSYLIIQTAEQIVCKLLPKCGANYEFVESDNKADDAKGNPIIDYIYSGYLKFGQTLGHDTHHYHFYDEHIYNIDVLEYPKSLFNGTTMRVAYLKAVENILDILNNNIFTNDMVVRIARVLVSRVPIQICTLENENIIPLIDGKRINFSDNFSKMKKIEEKAKFLSFGYIENLLKDVTEPVFLCCVIGKQSSGKSYLMNRIFDTRFDVRTTRCTDGIWMSYSYIEGKFIIIFDCEGLFSRQRKEIEEVKLLTFLAGVCDFTYLNQDLSFNRHLNNLLTNLSNSIGRLKGSNLFKGKLVWTVRDIRTSDQQGAYDEFKSHLDSFQKDGITFLKELFDSKIIFTCLNNFENNIFKSEIDNCRKDVLKEIKQRAEKGTTHWQNGAELMKNIKLLLVQLYTDDNTDLDILGQEFTMNELKDNLVEIWLSPKKYTGSYNTINDFLYTDGLSTPLTLIYDIGDITLDLKDNKGQDIVHIIKFFQQLMSENGIEYTKQTHSIYYNNCNQFFANFIIARKAFINAIMNEELGKIHHLPADKRDAFIRDFETTVIGNMNYILCLNICYKCNLECIKTKNHRKVNEERLYEIKKELAELNEHNIEDVERDLKRLDSLKEEIALLNDKKNNYLEEESKMERISDFNLTIRTHVESINQIEKDIKDIERDMFAYTNFDDAIKTDSPVYFILSDIIENFNQRLVSANIEYFNPNPVGKVSVKGDLLIMLENIQGEQETYKGLMEGPVLNPKKTSEDLVSLLNLKIKTELDLNKFKIAIDTIKQKLVNLENDISLNKKDLTKVNSKVPSADHHKNEKLKECELALERKKKDLADYENEYQKALDEVNKKPVSFAFNPFEIIKSYFNIKDIKANLKNRQEHNELLKKENENLKEELRIIENKKNLMKDSILNDPEYTNLQEILEYDQQAYASETEESLIAEIEKKIEIHENRIIEKQEKFEQELLQKEEYKNLSEEEEIRKEMIKSNLNEQEENNLKLTKLKSEKIQAENLLAQVNYNENKYLADFERDWFNEDFTKLLSIDEGHRRKVLDNFEHYLRNQGMNLTRDLNQGDDTDFYIVIIKGLKGEIRNLEVEVNHMKLNSKAVEDKSEHNEIIENIIKQREIEYSGLLAEQNELNKKTKICYDLVTKYDLEIRDEEEKLKRNNYNEIYLISSNKLISLEKETSFILDQVKRIEDEIICYINLHEKVLSKIIEKNHLIAVLDKQMEQDKDIVEFEGDYKKELQNIEKNRSDTVKEIKEKQTLFKNLEAFILKKNRKLQLLKEKSEIDEDLLMSCDCLKTDHKCSFDCKVCPDTPCKYKAGHNGDHLCTKENHSCLFKCWLEGCDNLCTKEADHDDEHKCDDSHLCKAICDVCPDNCALKMTEVHDMHQCKSAKCKKKCLLCLEECGDLNHFHEHETETVTYEDSRGSVIEAKKHLCGRVHNCTKVCNSPGVCFITYEEVPKEYIDHNGLKCNYVYLKPISDNKKCNKVVDIEQVKHDDPHNCGDKHRCQTRCPECGSVCKHEYDHSALVEHDFVHRNKEFCYFTNTTGEDIIIEDDTGKRTYKVKDQAIVENCNASCKRRGRGHIHLLKCEGGLSCRKHLPNGKYIVHSTKKYVGFEEEQFDEINCKDFWELFNIKNPIKQVMGHEGIIRDIHKCSYYCPFCYDPRNDKIAFCRDICGHSQSDKLKDHDFDCECKDSRSIYSGLDLCFVIDITGSMQSYITKSKNSISRITENVKKHLARLGSSVDSLKVGVVGYKDHGDEPITFKRGFSTPNEAMAYLTYLKADGGDDGHEATVDGLSEALKFSWRKDSEKILFLILDFPPHGKEFGNYGDSYPNGCPCGQNISKILASLDDLGVKVKLMKLTEKLEKTEIEFRKYHKNLESVNQAECAIDFERIICNLVVKSLVDKETSVVKLI